MKRVDASGFTLIELLIVLAIVSLLLQLLLPAVQMARESARQTHCQNNLRQLAVAAQVHVSAHGSFPSGGWAYAWVGDPDRGFGQSQPGGWGYNLLPYLEHQALRELGKGEPEPVRRAVGAQMFATPVPIFVCPSRRLARPWPFTRGELVNIEEPDKAGRSDYAANIGNLEPFDQLGPGPKSYEEADRWQAGADRMKHWMATRHNGIVFQRSTVKPQMVTDGLSKTYLFGEKFLDPRSYKGKRFSHGDDQSLYVGFDRDNVRSANELHPPLRDKHVPIVWLAEGDDERVTDWNFGSAHPSAVHMAYCDGSVKRVRYDVAREVHAAAGSRNGEESVATE